MTHADMRYALMGLGLGRFMTTLVSWMMQGVSLLEAVGMRLRRFV
jgi:hypothetical protein